jgi:hypothetical protein
MLFRVELTKNGVTKATCAEYENMAAAINSLNIYFSVHGWMRVGNLAVWQADFYQVFEIPESKAAAERAALLTA